MKKLLTFDKGESEYFLKENDLVIITIQTSNLIISGIDLFNKLFKSVDLTSKLDIIVENKISNPSSIDTRLFTEVNEIILEIQSKINVKIHPNLIDELL